MKSKCSAWLPLHKTFDTPFIVFFTSFPGFCDQTIKYFYALGLNKRFYFICFYVFILIFFIYVYMFIYIYIKLQESYCVCLSPLVGGQTQIQLVCSRDPQILQTSICMFVYSRGDTLTWHTVGTHRYCKPPYREDKHVHVFKIQILGSGRTCGMGW